MHKDNDLVVVLKVFKLKSCAIELHVLFCFVFYEKVLVLKRDSL